jgi:hypothetical protein
VENIFAIMVGGNTNVGSAVERHSVNTAADEVGAGHAKERLYAHTENANGIVQTVVGHLYVPMDAKIIAAKTANSASNLSMLKVKKPQVHKLHQPQRLLL